MDTKKCNRCKVDLPLKNYARDNKNVIKKQCIKCNDKVREHRKMIIYEKLVDGIRALYNIDMNEEKQNYHKCGGDGPDNDKKRFKVNFKDIPFPSKVFECPCGHDIINNCYVTRDNDYKKIIIVGNCCVNHFPSGNKRICVTCQSEHKNISTDKCNKCRYLKNV